MRPARLPGWVNAATFHAIVTPAAVPSQRASGRPGAWPIQAHLLALVLGVALPLLAFSGLLALRYAEAERARIEAGAANSAREVAAGLDIMLSEVASTARVLAGTEALQAGDLAGFHPRAVAAMQTTGGNVGVRGADSGQLLSSVVPWGQPLPGRTNLAAQDAEAARTGRPAVSDGYAGFVDGTYQFAVVLPVQPAAGPARFLSLSVPALRVQQVLDGVITLAPGMRAGVVDRRGNFLARRPDPQGWIGRPAAVLSGGAASGSVAGLGTDKEPTRFFVQQSSVSGWRVGIAVPEAVLWAPLQRLIWTLGALAAAMLGLAFTAAWLGSRRIAGAIRALSVAGEALQRGEPVPPLATTLREANQVGAALAASSERRRIREQALRESEARLRAVLDTVPVSVVVAESPSGRLLFGNPGVERVFRHPLIASGSVDEYREWESYHADGSRVLAREYPLAQTLATGDPAEGEYEFVCGDGVRRWISVVSAVIRGADGTMTGALVVCTDVDGKRRAEAHLRASEERFRMLAATMPALIFVTDAVGANTYTNTVFQQFTGRSSEELLGDGWLDTLHPDDRERAGATWSKAWQTGAAYDAEYRFRHHGDGHRWHLVRGTPVRDGEGRITQWVGACTDVQEVVDARNALAAANAGLEARVAERTAELAGALARMQEEMRERAAAEAQVRQLQKMEAVGQLTGGIAHDFNNMLAVVTGSLDLAKRRLGSGDADRALRGIENAEEGARRAAQLTARLLAFSRQTALEPQVVDANKLVGGMSELLRRSLGEGVRVETVLAGGLWRTHADPGQLENALLNLCVNARDAMPEGGKLTIETANCHLDDAYAGSHAEVSPGQYVLVAVTDTGTGMPPEVAAHAFDPFYTTKGVGKGTGLGLSQVYGFVKQSGGHVKIYSEPGQGTTVKVYLPRRFGADAAVADAQPPFGELPRARDGEVVLVVEDEAAVRHVSVDALRELGYTVVQASDANQALGALAVQPRVDLLFTDIVMPEMNGRRLADEALRLLPGLRVLFTTGYTRNAVVHNGTLDPGVALLPKPFMVEQLARKVRAVLDGEGVNRVG